MENQAYEKFLLTHLREQWESAVSAEAAERAAAVSGEVTARNSAINAAVAPKAEVVTGTYTGTAPYTDGNTTQTITLGFKPKLVFAVPQDQGLNGSSGRAYGGLVIDGHPACYNFDEARWVGKTTATGFQVKNIASSMYMNYENKQYIYFAVK